MLIRNKLPCMKYLTLCKLKKRVYHKLGGGFANYLMLCLIILSRKTKNEILDIFYNGLTDASRDYLDSCVGSLFRERTPDEAEILLNNMLTNENNWAPPEQPPEPVPEPITEPIPKPTLKKRGVLFLSPEDMQEAKKSMKKKVLKLKMLRI